QRCEKRFGRHVVLVRPHDVAAERQRVAFEAALEEIAGGDAAHIVNAHYDRGEFANRIRDACLEAEKLPVVGPAGPSPAEVSEDSYERLAAIDGGLDPIADLLKQGVARALSRDEMQPVFPPQGRRID